MITTRAVPVPLPTHACRRSSVPTHRDFADPLLTLVDAGGTPQPAPIWFLWDGESALVYSDGKARRLTHLRANPRVALHLDGDQHGGDIVVLTGEITESPDEPAVPDNAAYLAKYGTQITGGWGTPEAFAETFSVPLRFRPRRVRGH